MLASQMNAVVWQSEHSLALPVFGTGMKSPAEFSKFDGTLSAALSQHHLLGFEIAQLEFLHFHSFVHSEAS